MTTWLIDSDWRYALDYNKDSYYLVRVKNVEDLNEIRIIIIDTKMQKIPLETTEEFMRLNFQILHTVGGVIIHRLKQYYNDMNNCKNKLI